MKIIKISLVILISCCTVGALAQPSKTAPAKSPVSKPIKDSFAFNVLSTIDKVLRFAEDTKKPAMAMAGELLRTDQQGSGIYQPTIVMPGSVSMGYRLSKTYRDLKSTTWEWKAIMLDLPKDQGAAAIQVMKTKIDSLLLSFRDRQKQHGVYYTLHTFTNLSASYRQTDQLELVIFFDKGLHNSEQAVIDSLKQLYRSLLANKRTASECAEKFGKALAVEGIPDETIKKVDTEMIVEVANKDAEAAYQALISIPYPADYMAIFEKLPPAAKEVVRSLAKQAVEKFYDEQNGRYNNSRPDIVVEKKKEIDKETPPGDPCQREMWETGVKPGHYLSGDGAVSYVTDYSCSMHTYTIAWVDNGKLKFKPGVTREEIKKYSRTSGSPFLVCSHCQGQGYSMEYDWYQVNAYSGYHARSNKQTRYSCGQCKGAGFMKVR
jgi:hypothetical protein